MPFYAVVLNGAVLLVVLHYMYRKRALKNIVYSRSFNRSSAFEGDRVEMVEVIENRKLLPVPWLRLESLLSRDLRFARQTNLDIRSGERLQNHLSLFSLRPYRRIVRRHEVRCAKRGFYTLGTATMTAGEPLGLVHVSRQFPVAQAELLVYPRIGRFGDLPLPSHSWLGNLAVRRWIAEDPFLSAGTRAYAPGDPLSGIHWKATARTGSLQVHRKDFTADHRLVICLNMEIDSAMWKTVTEPERIEEGIRYAATVADYALRSGIETGLLSNGWVLGEAKNPARIEPGGGAVQLDALLGCLAKLQLETVSNMAYLLEQEAERRGSRSDYVIVTCHREEKLSAAADRLRGMGHGIEWLIIPEAIADPGGDELEPPVWDMESNG
ncbi:DUF58 domain-containing protein [Cohnella sp. CFH 77786]|uniref:DUF58 domain-containing protein n=1 Tax=Cohnella sp. CFH 77786 TaxID=2662265 RepID=UPI001C609361|nr:DUF58 domain-containing protein [Cohnella sp. CFH 77786]MBW5446878.1 DUF58 domain-containing protein [Cohnella sp. CFH 77786]